jgi:MFS transporter, SHS family, lactate transporter
MAPYFIHNLVPRRQARDANRKPLLQVLRSLTWLQWLQFFTGCDPVLSCMSLAETNDSRRWLAWSSDAIDFFNVALSVTRLQEQFHKPNPASIVCNDPIFSLVLAKALLHLQTTAITFTLLVRSIGAVSTSSRLLDVIRAARPSPRGKDDRDLISNPRRSLISGG